jgi:hypothetical protein
MRRLFLGALAALVIIGTTVSLRARVATPLYAEGLVVFTSTATATVTETATTTATATATATTTSTATRTATATATATPTTTATSTATPTVTNTATKTRTPTATATWGPVRMPLVFKQASWTPTATATATRTPTASATSGAITTGMTGQLARTEPNKPTYATFIENVWMYEWIFNPKAYTINFGVLGLAATGPVNLPFKTSWDGAGVPGGQLQIYAGCHGPAGIPCAGSTDAGRHVDHVGDNGGGEHSPWEITKPGVYQVTFYVCYSTFTACQQPGGVWQALSGPVSFTAIDWTPQPDQGVAPTPAPYVSADYGPVCYLITDDPAGIYLSCPKAEAQHRPLARLH